MVEYKNKVDSKTKTGKRRKDFKYYDEMHSVLKDRPDIHPPVLMGSGIGVVLNENEKETEKENAIPEEDSEIKANKKRAKGKDENLKTKGKKAKKDDNETIVDLVKSVRSMTDALHEHNRIEEEKLNVFKNVMKDLQKK